MSRTEANITIIVLCAVILVLFPQLHLFGGSSTSKSSISANIARTKQIVLACRLYATDYDGALPTGHGARV